MGGSTPHVLVPAADRAPAGEPGPGRPLGRRSLLGLGGLALAGAATAACSSGSDESTQSGATTAGAVEPAGAPAGAEPTLSPTQALARLTEGNGRFVAGTAEHPDQTAQRRTAVATGQHPFAQILSCADSRVPPEIVFDQGLGHLFTVRSAGQVVDHAVLGTIQFGTAELAIPLVLVLGHTACGAVKATAEAVEKKSPKTRTDVDALVDAIRPAVEAAEETEAEDVVATAVRTNVANIVRQLIAAPVLADAVKAGTLQVSGAVYDLGSGRVALL